MLRRFKKHILKFASVNAENREAWVRASLTALPRGLRVLDAGAGESPYRDCCAGQEYVAQDFAKYDGMGDGTGLQTGTWDQTKVDIVSDITAIPAPSGSFDVVICTEVLEHIPDPASAIAEFTRLLKNGGILIITAPFYSMTHFAPYHFFTGFSRYFYEEYLVRRHGYEIVEMVPSGSFFAVVGQEIVLVPALCRRYSASWLAAASWAVVIPIVWLLRLIARYDTGSSELLCFEYFVRAKKQGK